MISSIFIPNSIGFDFGSKNVTIFMLVHIFMLYKSVKIGQKIQNLWGYSASKWGPHCIFYAIHFICLFDHTFD